MPTPVFGLPLYGDDDTAELDTLLNGQSTALEVALLAFQIPISVANVAERDERFPSPSPGARVFRRDVSWEERWSGESWLIAPGTVLATGSANTASSGANTLLLRVKTPTLPAGQPVLITGGGVGMSNANASTGVVNLRYLDNGTDVASATGLLSVLRFALSAGSLVSRAAAQQVRHVMPSQNTLSVGLFTSTAYPVYTADPQYIHVVAA